MRSTAVQIAKWNPNKRSHFALMTLSVGQRKALALAQRTTEKCSVRALILFEPHAFKHTSSRFALQHNTHTHNGSLAKIPRSKGRKLLVHRPNGKRTNNNFKSSKEITTDPPKIPQDPSL